MNKVLIIAEVGVNHNGSIEIAKKMIDMAALNRADIVKFQTFISKNLTTKNSEKANYQKENTCLTEKQQEMLKKLELSEEQFKELKTYCDSIGITFLSTPFDLESIGFLNTLDLPFWKIPSGEITNLPYLIKIGETKKPVVLSTGMCELEEIEKAVGVLKKQGAPKITLLHCNTEYPTPYGDVNLNAMLTLKEKFDCEIGYSDHTLGIEVPIAAVALGATIIEKHFTLDKKMEGPDHQASLEPEELKAMVNSIRNIEVALGNGVKKPSHSEKKNIEIARKSIVAKCEIKENEFLTEDNITTKRPGNGISPMKWFEVLGTKATRDYLEDELIEK